MSDKNHTTVSRKEFINALSLLGRVTGRRLTLPILSMARLTATKTTLSIAGTDLDVFASVSMAATGQEWKALVPIAKTYGVVSAMSGDELSIENNGKVVVLKCGPSICSLAAPPVGEFPPDPKMDGEKVLLSQKEFKDCLAANYAACTDQTRYALRGVNVVLSDGKVTFAASDGRRLATATMPHPGKEKFDIIIPTPTVNLLAGILEGGDLFMSVSESSVTFIAGEITLSSKLIEGNYPNYKQVIPNGGEVVKVNILEWLQAVKFCVSMQSERSFGVLVTIGGGKVSMKSQSATGHADTSFDAECTGKEIAFRINGEYLSEALAAMGESCELHFADALLPLKLTSENKLAVIMPLRMV